MLSERGLKALRELHRATNVAMGTGVIQDAVRGSDLNDAAVARWANVVVEAAAESYAGDAEALATMSWRLVILGLCVGIQVERRRQRQGA
jgi:hypothetical protein